MSFMGKILTKSNSYNYYKNEHENLVKENNNLKKENKTLKSDIKRLEKKTDELLREVRKINSNAISNNWYNRLVNEELKFAFVFNDSIKDSDWVKFKNFSLVNAAANYSFMYVLFRILNDGKPKNILEMGLGQTTKLTSQYASHFNDVNLTVLEGDEVWIEKFSESLELPDNMKIINMDLEMFEYNNTENLRFKNIAEVLENQKYDLIVIDGPQGFIVDSENVIHELDYSRANIWELIPDNLMDDFVILIDDYNRIGEKNTIAHAKELLLENNIEFGEFDWSGLKSQHAIFTEMYKFVGWF